MGIEGRPGKRRGPWAVWLLALVTCGVYGLVWYYKTNRELRDCGAGIKVRPVLCVLALVPGVVLCYVPLFTSIYRTGERIRRAQAHAGLEPTCGPGRALLLVFALGLWPVYYQAQLNKAWIASAPAVDGGSEGSAEAGETAPEPSADAEEAPESAQESESVSSEPVAASDEADDADEAGNADAQEPEEHESEDEVPAKPEPEEAAEPERADSTG